ncbi:MAG: hypothetical protein H0X41_08245 [Chitinophagaceae bacterium]|nr:hypothetical protein [Chitinophagaceae bacterium]
MISVIICSKEQHHLERLSQNIRETIGVPYEIIATDNSVRQEGICAVYNSAASKARFSLLCFVHEDVLFDTPEWGKKIFMHLQNKDIGLIGIAGGDAKSLVPSSWYIPARSNHIHVFQHYRYNDTKPTHILVTDPNNDCNAKRASALDGVFLCTRKEVFDQHPFDEVLFRGFHGYDIDYSLQVSTTHELLSISDILIHHFSEGRPNRQWMESTLQVSRKWKKRLPVSVHPLTHKEFGDHHWAAMQMFIQRLVTMDYSTLAISRYFIYYSFNSFFTIRRFGSMTKYLLTCLAERASDERKKTLAEPSIQNAFVNPEPVKQRQ